MSTFYEEMRAEATELLGPGSEFAQGVLALRRMLPGSIEPPYAPHNPGPATPQDYGLSGAVRGVSAKYVDGTLVVASDLQASVAVPEVEPTMTDKVVVDGREHTMVRVIRLPSAGIAVAYVLIIRT